MAIERVGVLGCGLMGSGIAEVAARAGMDVRVGEVSSEAVESGRERILASMDRAVSREKLSAKERDGALTRLSFTTDLDGFADREIVIEAIVEDLQAKREILGALDGICPPETIFASNTSSLTITELAASLGRVDRVIGLHFFNPVPVMRLVEVVRTLETSTEAFDRAVAFVRELDKVPISAPDRSGFVVNLLLIPFLLDAVRHLERGVAPMEELDRAMVLGCGHPMGPFTLLDFVGIDTALRIAEIMYDEYREGRYAPPPLLRRLVSLGRYGRKSGRGFYDYSGESPVPLEF
jgi:3-hydroxybutyryl-CoA dehydrogenase